MARYLLEFNNKWGDPIRQALLAPSDAEAHEIADAMLAAYEPGWVPTQPHRVYREVPKPELVTLDALDELAPPAPEDDAIGLGGSVPVDSPPPA